MQADRSGLAVFSLAVPAYDPGRGRHERFVFVFRVQPTRRGKALEMFRKDDRTVLPNPSRQYRRGKPLYVYFEIYYLGYQRHRVAMQVEDRYGHRIWRDQRSFPGYRGAVEFAEGIPTHDLFAGACTRCGFE